jgi:alkanesulfonate monooxygenase SsuD/methylene tetrahydromethanopterin reductase-like flavin-dependent oxidoreductase (luciferase family)
MKLAGQIGDGILLSAGLTHAYTHRCLEAVDAGAREEGRDPNAVRKAGFINFNVSTDGKAAKAALLRKLAFLFRSKGHSENIKSSGLDIDHEGIIAALARRDLDAGARLLPEEAATVFGVAGTPSECRDQLEGYLAMGLTEPDHRDHRKPRGAQTCTRCRARVVGRLSRRPRITEQQPVEQIGTGPPRPPVSTSEALQRSIAFGPPILLIEPP